MISDETRRGRWPLTAEQRFWSKVDRSGECWIWTGKNVTKKSGGYGRLTVAGKQVLAHRYAWELKHGPIPDGKKVLHRCDVTLCMRDEHLFLGTQLENIADREIKGRTARGETAGNVRLMDDQVREIRASTEPAKKIAAKYGISHWYVYSLRYREWRKSA